MIVWMLVFKQIVKADDATITLPFVELLNNTIVLTSTPYFSTAVQ